VRTGPGDARLITRPIRTLRQILRHISPGLSLAVTTLTILAMVGITILQSALVLGLVRFEQILRTVLILGGLVGLWWRVIGILSLSSEALPISLASLSIAADVSGVLVVVGFWLWGQEHPLAAIGFLTNALIVPVWVIWLGRLLLSGDLLTGSWGGEGGHGEFGDRCGSGREPRCPKGEADGRHPPNQLLELYPSR
jgi:hypothetical protein